MSKYAKNNKKKPVRRKVLLVLLLIVALIAFVLFGMPRILYYLNGENQSSEFSEFEQSADQTEQTEIAVETIPFPILLEEGKLEIDSLFSFSGINPDGENQDGDDIAAILVKNTSDTYLETAVIALTIPDGTQLNFKVTDLPAGKSVMAFSLDNTIIGTENRCTEITCDAEFNMEASLQTERVSVSVSAMSVTLTNNTEEELSNLVIYCRTLFGEDYFGGLAYQYPVSNIPAKGSTTVEAVDCILGVAEVVRIEINN